MRKYNIPIAKTNLRTCEINSVLEPLKSGWLVQGPKVKEFEDKWSEFTSSKHSIAVTSCTSALQISLAAIGFGIGDEAIVPAFTWVSTANVVEHLGGKVTFCDINLETFNLDVDELEKIVTPSTKAIIPVHLFGLAAEMSEIMALAKKYHLNVVEDAACGFGTTYKGKHVGLFGDTGCFSFHPRKSITTGEGGMITTQDDGVADRVRCLRDHGAQISDLQRHRGPKPYLLSDHILAGYNQRMTDIQGALGSKQMDRARHIIEERQHLAQRYTEAFKNIEWLQTPYEYNENKHAYQSYPCLFCPEKVSIDNVNKISQQRNSWMEKLQSNGISTRPATHAVHMLKFYLEKYSIEATEFPNALIANNCSISLPLYNGMSKDEQDYVIERVLEAHF